MFVWARLRDGVDATDLLKVAIERKVMFVPGAAFHGAGAEAQRFVCLSRRLR